MRKKYSLSIIELVIIILVSAIVIIIPLLVFNKYIDTEWLEELVSIGNNISGMLIPLLTVFGSILVYMAFKAQVHANEQIREQFEKQNYDQHFFRLISSLEKKILSYSLSEIKSEQTHAGYNVLIYFQKALREKNAKLKNEISFTLLCNYPDRISDYCYKELYKGVDGDIYSTFESLKNAFIQGDFKKRQNIINNHFQDMEYNPEYTNALNIIYTEHFYDMDYKIYKVYYRSLAVELFENYAVFFDGYFKTISMLIKHIDKSDIPYFYIEFLNENLTTLEKVLILLYVGTGKSSAYINSKVLEYKLLEHLINVQGIRPVAEDESGKYERHIIQLLKQTERI